MIREDERNYLILYRLQQSKETIGLAEFLLNSGKLTVAVNRIYYGMYYALTALALKYHYETSKHAQLIGWFNKEFISTGKVGQKTGMILRNAFQNRTRGDYDAFVEFSISEVTEMLEDMKIFIKTIEKIINT